MSISYSNFNLDIEAMTDDEYNSKVKNMYDETNLTVDKNVYLHNKFNNTYTEFNSTYNDYQLFENKYNQSIPEIEGFTDEVKSDTYKQIAQSLDNSNYSECIKRNAEQCNELQSIRDMNQATIPKLADVRNNTKLDFQSCERHFKNCNTLYKDINSYTENLNKIMNTIDELEYKVNNCKSRKDYCDTIDNIVDNLEKQIKDQKNSINDLYDLNNKYNCT